jgi:endonuclease/exonuclease/phosphatase family metal-dependent hydrolase
VIRALSWNLYHGRDFPPDRSLRTWRSRILRLDEHNATHRQVNRDLLDEFAAVIAGAAWDVALLQECPPRWARELATRARAESHISLTSRNSLSALRALLARQNPDLVASNEGGSNLTLVRGDAIVARAEHVLTTAPERRTMVLSRLASGLAVANLHASNAAQEKTGPEILAAAARATAWHPDGPLILGGDFNLRPDRAGDVFATLEREHGLRAPTSPDRIDHILVRDLEVAEAPRAWPAERREVDDDGLAVRLSDHAPVEAAFREIVRAPTTQP